MIAVVIFAVLIVVFAAIALFFLIMIIRLKREQRYVHSMHITCGHYFVSLRFVTGRSATAGVLKYEFCIAVYWCRWYNGDI